MTPLREGPSCLTYATESEARTAVERLLAAGVPETSIHVLMGEGAGDGGRAPVSAFAGSGGPVGAFAGGSHAGAERMGGFAGDPAHARRGGFADRDRDTVAERAGGAEHVGAASHEALERLLVDAGVEPAQAKADLDALHRGRVLVLVTAA